MDLEGKKTAPSTPIYSGEAHGSFTPCPWHSPPPLQHHLLLRSAWRSPAGELQAPPRRRAAGALPQLILSPCWIKKEETSQGCTCVERRGAVRSVLDQIFFCDLNRREYDSINRVLVTLPLSDLQGYEDALPLSLVASIS